MGPTNSKTAIGGHAGGAGEVDSTMGGCLARSPGNMRACVDPGRLLVGTGRVVQVVGAAEQAEP